MIDALTIGTLRTLRMNLEDESQEEESTAVRVTYTQQAYREAIAALDEVLAFFTWTCPDSRCGGPLQLGPTMVGGQTAYCPRCRKLYDARRWLDPEHTAKRSPT